MDMARAWEALLIILQEEPLDTLVYQSHHTMDMNLAAFRLAGCHMSFSADFLESTLLQRV